MERLEFEHGQFLVVRNGDTVLFRCPISLTDLGDYEPLSVFIARHGGLKGVISYLRRELENDTRRSVDLRPR